MPIYEIIRAHMSDPVTHGSFPLYKSVVGMSVSDLPGTAFERWIAFPLIDFTCLAFLRSRARFIILACSWHGLGSTGTAGVKSQRSRQGF
jgi:hypothetical protein